eukprot:TRINITY_DN814_c0_g1_i1.p1 TRINITY_DN814_c0_g1~~TRINITY_DN814_c0_g1_i1.p1  ORF type:complete len:104 (+),score=15.88 TRINITY_DN814_c0_g1_i1:196-507(+)
MDQRTFRFIFRSAIIIALLFVLFYLGRPVWWGISARLQEARQKKVDVSATELASHGMQELKNYVAKKTGFAENAADAGGRRSLKALHHIPSDVKIRVRRLLQL